MRKNIAAIALLLLTAGCHGKVVSTAVGAKSQETFQESCPRSGWCHQCNTRYVGSGQNRHPVSDCGNGYHFDCPGIRTVTEERWNESRRYEDGYVGVYEQSKVIRKSACR